MMLFFNRSAWLGKKENTEAALAAFKERLKINALSKISKKGLYLKLYVLIFRCCQALKERPDIKQYSKSSIATNTVVAYK